MDKRKETIVEFINLKIDQLLTELKIEIEKILQRDFSLKTDDIEPLLKQLAFKDSEGVGGVEPLYQLNLILKQSVNQKELIEGFFSTLNEYSRYMGFFIFKGDFAICYAAMGEGNRPRKDFKIKKPIFMEPSRLTEDIFPQDLISLFDISKTIAIPLLIKYKQAGFFIFEMKDVKQQKIFEIATSMFERELNLLPLKSQGEIKTHHLKTVEKKEEHKVEKNGVEDPVMKKAKRFANALASDIKLYNEEKIKQGIETGNLRELLKEDIEKSYAAFRERYPDKNKFPDSIFEDALIKYVANGNKDLLK